MIPKIPQKLKTLFWEYDFKILNPDRHRRFIIERILEKGSLSSIRWLFDVYSRNEIENVIMTSNNLSKKTVDFWNICL